MNASIPEQHFAFLLSTIGRDIPAPEGEYRFAAEWVGGTGDGLRSRLKQAGLHDWRIDFAWVAHKLAVEIEGATWTNGRHNRGSGFENDAEKYNWLESHDWHVLRFTTTMLRTNPHRCIEQVRALSSRRRLQLEKRIQRQEQTYGTDRTG